MKRPTRFLERRVFFFLFFFEAGRTTPSIKNIGTHGFFLYTLNTPFVWRGSSPRKRRQQFSSTTSRNLNAGYIRLGYTTSNCGRSSRNFLLSFTFSSGMRSTRQRETASRAGIDHPISIFRDALSRTCSLNR